MNKQFILYGTVAIALWAYLRDQQASRPIILKGPDLTAVSPQNPATYIAPRDLQGSIVYGNVGVQPSDSVVQYNGFSPQP